jgi:hypothetical protein
MDLPHPLFLMFLAWVVAVVTVTVLFIRSMADIDGDEVDREPDQSRSNTSSWRS